MAEARDIYIAPILPGHVRAVKRRPRPRIVRHNWDVQGVHMTCADESHGHRIGHDCAGCGAHISVAYLEITFAGSSDHYADADVVAAPLSG